MRKFYTVSTIAAIAFGVAGAQQLPNVGFEGEWEKSTPWNSKHNGITLPDAVPEEMMFFYPDGIEGLQPAGWTVSHVIGVLAQNEETGSWTGMGATEVGGKTKGYNSESAVLLKNSPNPFMAVQVVPAYISLGHSWATNTLDFFGKDPIQNKDGGVFGGIEFTARPDAIEFMYKRSHGVIATANEDGTSEEKKSDEKATVVVYSWKGSWTQEAVPAVNSMSSSIPDEEKTTMVDRDRNILGMETAVGGKVTKTDDAELIAKTIAHIEGDADQWTRFITPISYLSDATPEKINVVIAANDYFNSDRIGNGDSLSVDDVKFIYYSRLSGIFIGGKNLPDFDPDTYNYVYDGTMPMTDDSYAELYGEGKSASIKYDYDTNTAIATITVTNTNGTDVDGKSTHVYTVQFNETEDDGISYSGYLNIEMMGSMIAENQAATIVIKPNSDNTCTFALPNFALDLGDGPVPMGDIIVPKVSMTESNGTTTYKGSVSGMELLGGEIVCDVNVEGSSTADGKINMKIQVLWMGIPIDVTFTGSTTGIENITSGNDEPVEFYNLQGVKVDSENMPAGIYIRRQGNKVAKIYIR